MCTSSFASDCSLLFPIISCLRVQMHTLNESTKWKWYHGCTQYETRSRYLNISYAAAVIKRLLPSHVRGVVCCFVIQYNFTVLTIHKLYDFNISFTGNRHDKTGAARFTTDATASTIYITVCAGVPLWSCADRARDFVCFTVRWPITTDFKSNWWMLAARISRFGTCSVRVDMACKKAYVILCDRVWNVRCWQSLRAKRHTYMRATQAFAKGVNTVYAR